MGRPVEHEGEKGIEQDRRADPEDERFASEARRDTCARNNHRRYLLDHAARDEAHSAGSFQRRLDRIIVVMRIMGGEPESELERIAAVDPGVGILRRVIGVRMVAQMNEPVHRQRMESHGKEHRAEHFVQPV